MSDVFKELIKVDVSKHVEKKNGLAYLSWAWAWQYVKEKFPSANYNVVHFDGKPYLFDENLGYLFCTEVTIEGETIPMSLPVMDGANKAMKHVSYKYKTKNGDKTVEAATMFDLNKAMMRCLVKNLAMFGLGLYIYAGEDLPIQTVVEYFGQEEISKVSEVAVGLGYTVEQVCQSYGVESLAVFPKDMVGPVCETIKGWGQAFNIDHYITEAIAAINASQDMDSLASVFKSSYVKVKEMGFGDQLQKLTEAKDLTKELIESENK